MRNTPRRTFEKPRTHPNLKNKYGLSSKSPSQCCTQILILNCNEVLTFGTHKRSSKHWCEKQSLIEDLKWIDHFFFWKIENWKNISNELETLGKISSNYLSSSWAYWLWYYIFYISMTKKMTRKQRVRTRNPFLQYKEGKTLISR